MNKVAFLNGQIEAVEFCDVKPDAQHQLALFAVEIPEAQADFGNGVVSAHPPFLANSRSGRVEVNPRVFTKGKTDLVEFLPNVFVRNLIGC